MCRDMNMTTTSTSSVKKLRLFLIVIILFGIGMIFVTYQVNNLKCNNKATDTEVEPSNKRTMVDDEPSNKRTMIDDEENILQILMGTVQRFEQDDPKLINYVREKFLVPPNNKPYNLKDSFNRNPSQAQQNLFVLNLLNNKTNGFFIECGAWDGEFLSNSLFLERDYGWTGLLIEARRDSYHHLTLRNRKSWISNACLSTLPYPKIMNFYIDDNGIASLLNSSAEMKKLNNYEPKNSYEVQCIPLYTYLAALNINIIDYLSLDVEGADFDVLKTIPFDKVIFKVLEVETAVLKEGKSAVRKFLETKGYVFITEIWPDYIFAHTSLANTLNLTNWQSKPYLS